LPVREYPDVDPPVLSVTTVHRGASADVIEAQVTQIIEEAVAGIEGIDRVTSTSRDESSSVSIEFTLARDIDAAANDVRDRIARSINRLPEAAETPRIAKQETDARPIIWMRLTSDRHDALELSDYANRFLVDAFSIVPGVATARVYGERRYSMRIWLYRQPLAARGLTVQDVENAIRRQNIELPSGRLESTQRELTVRTASALSTPEQFRNIVIKRGDDFLVRLGEVAKVEVAPENDRSEFRADGRLAIGLGVIKQSKANTLEVAEGARKVAEGFQESLPPGMSLNVNYDSSVFIRKSIEEVFVALSIALALVVGVILLFLRSWRATAIPAMAIPVSVIASFTVLAALGYSVNVLTLLAFVLAIGLVVDDAIVVVENIHRHIEQGVPPLLAAVQGTRQIAFAVIATTVTLIAVFVPLSFMEGSTGRLFREFGVAVAVAVIFSSFAALSLTPMMCSKLLRPTRDEGWVFKATQPVFDGLNRGYGAVLRWALSAPIVVVAIAIAISGAAYSIFLALPKEFAPTEDRGVLFMPISAPEGSSLEYTLNQVRQLENRLQPIVDRGDGRSVLSLVAPGFGRPGAVNSAFMILQLQPWDQRQVSQMEIQRELFPKLASLPGIRAFPLNPPSLGQRSFRSPVQFILGGPSYEVLEEWAGRLMARARQNNRLLNLDTDYDETRAELRVTINRDHAADLGVSVEEVGRTLETMLGERRVTTFEDRGEQFDVILRARARDRETQSDISNIFVRSTVTGNLIPLSSVIEFKEAAGAKELNRTDRLRSITVSASLAPGYTLGAALEYFEKLAAEELPPEARISYGGLSQTFRESSSSLYVIFGLALLIVFLALAAQFESFIHPMVIMLSVPLAITGALGSMMYMGLSVNIYTQIGMIMLIGLVAKNGILIVEFANQLRDSGMEIRDAAYEASIVRLRPVLMTTIATALGAVPLAISTGAGAESRNALGIVIIGGVSFATVLSLFLIPVLYAWLARFTKPTGYIARSLSSMEAEDRSNRKAAVPAE
ncbi:MAG: efflux RND transporter permease subunit, partial [Proteobacteria bacterium]|nr:efflux RND transporter permease subunit [Pseudomonadota bacterium]